MKADFRILGPAIALAFLHSCQTTPTPPPGPQFAVVLRPVRDAGAEVIGIDVRSEVRGLGADKPFAMTAPIVYPGSRNIPDRMLNLTVRDGQGDVPLTVKDDPAVPGGFPYFRHWAASRAVFYPVTISYRALVQPAGEPGGPPFGIRPSAGGVSGAGSTFIIIPEGLGAMPARLKWDLGAMPPGSIGVTSFGENEVIVERGPSQLLQAWYLAGPAGRYPASGDEKGFSAAWLGDFSFDEGAEMKWAANMYAYLGKAFGYLDPPPRYRVFMRYLDTPPTGGGTALPNSFMLSSGVGARQGGSPRGTFTHEMIHQWTGGIEGPNGITSWFSEGLTTFYTALLPMRGGFTSVDEYGRNIAGMSNGYWGVAAWNWSAAKIADTGFGDEQTRHVPYNRSALYFADLDARIRIRSGGKRNLDDFLRPMFERRQKGEAFTQDVWIGMVTAELGADAGEQFRRVILDGEPLIPEPNAFGPCFERRPKEYNAGSEKVSGFEWVRLPSVPEATCRAW